MSDDELYRTIQQWLQQQNRPNHTDTALEVLDQMTLGWKEENEAVCAHFRFLLVQLLRQLADLQTLNEAPVLLVEKLLDKFVEVVPDYRQVYSRDPSRLNMYLNWAQYLGGVGQTTVKNLLNRLHTVSLDDLLPGISNKIADTAGLKGPTKGTKRSCSEERENVKRVKKEDPLEVGEPTFKTAAEVFLHIYGCPEQGYVISFGQP